jgi:L-iditol 2-dehydrogenase
MGAGPIGCLHIVVAKVRGARVILSEPSDVRRKLAQAFAPDLVIDPSNEAVVERVRQFTGGLGADIAICANPVAATQAQAVEAVRKAGRVILFGGLPKANPLTSLNGNLIHYGEITVIGAFSYHPTYHQQALDVIGRGSIPADRFITHTFALEHINDAFNAAAGGQALKVMVETQQTKG